MAIHDWTRVHDCLFHDFHLSWVAEICRQLNQGRLPPSHFALSETLELRPPPGFASLPEPDQHAREIEAPEALLLVARLVQGFSTGGEYGGAATFIAEFSTDIFVRARTRTSVSFG